MSAQSGSILRPILLRSSSPSSNEKVLSYLEGMARETAASRSPPASLKGASDDGQNRVLSPKPRSAHTDPLDDLAKSPVNYDDMGPQDGQDDFGSNVQEQSEGEAEPLQMREPGPLDPPGPHYESYDSGPSFGNKGPLPEDNHYSFGGGWTPNWGGVNAAGQPPYMYHDALMAQNVPLPGSAYASPKPTSMNIAIQSPSVVQRHVQSQSNGETPLSPTKSKPSVGRVASPLGQSHSSSSPLSPVSKKTKGTAYPALPESRFGDADSEGPIERPESPVRAPSVVPSVSPSDSPSQMKPRKSPPPADPASRPNPSIPYNRSPLRNSVVSGHQGRPFSPYRHGPTNEDLLYAATRGRALVIPEEAPAPIPPPNRSKTPSVALPAVVAPISPPASPQTRPVKAKSNVSKIPTIPPSMGVVEERAPTPRAPTIGHEDLNAEEQQIVNNALASASPHTSHYTPSTLEPEATHTPYHDQELCALFGQLSDPKTSEFVKKALRKAIRQRVKKLGLKHDNESLKEYQHHHSHDDAEEPPRWATDLKREMVLMQQRIESLGPKIESLQKPQSFADEHSFHEDEELTQTPRTQTVNIHTQPTGTLADSMYIPPETEIIEDGDGGGFEHEEEEEEEEFEEEVPENQLLTRPHLTGTEDGKGSPGRQVLQEEFYKLQQKDTNGSQSGQTHQTWQITRDHGYEDGQTGQYGSQAPASEYAEERAGTPSAPQHEVVAAPQAYWDQEVSLTPWQKVQQRLLSWAVTWPMSTVDAALNSTTRSHQVDEVALSIWCTQTYKRYVRSKLTDNPQEVVDRLFVPPNVADAVNAAVFAGRHGEVAGLLRELWGPFGLEGMPRLIIVLSKHRTENDHWTVHRFSLPEGSLTTYDTYPDKMLPDGRPLGWWFGIRFAWPDAIYPVPTEMIQKLVRLHRPMQLPIDNSVAAAGIWRNLLMGSKAERSLDLERLRDLINQEVKNLRQRKQLGKLSVIASQTRPNWDLGN